MKDIKTLDKRYETVAWGTGFLWIGILGLIPGDQDAVAVLGIGFVLLSLNLARFLRGIPVNAFTVVLGILSTLLGLVAWLRSQLNLPHYELDLFSLMLIVIGLYFLIPPRKQVEG